MSRDPFPLSRPSLERLLKTLLSIGQERPNVLLSLTQVVQPLLLDEYRVPLLTRMFQDAPDLLAALTPDQLREISLKPPADAVSLKLLLDLRSLLSLLASMSYLQLANLSKSLCGQAPQQALSQLEHLQALLQSWGLAALREHHTALATTPVHLERSTLMRLEPHLRADSVALCVALIKMPFEELEALKLWAEGLSQSDLILIVNLLQVELQELLEVRRRVSEAKGASAGKRAREEDDAVERFGELSLEPERKVARAGSADLRMSLGMPIDLDLESVGVAGDGDFGLMDFGLDANMELGMENTIAWDTMGDDASYLDMPLSLSQFVAEPVAEVKPEPLDEEVPPPPQPNLDLMETSPPVGPLSLPMSSLSAPIWQLRIQKQPPAQTVYQRIVKPFPAIALVSSHSSAQSAQYNLFVEATVIRGDSEKELPLCLDGSRVIRIQAGALATYRKLKILATTAQQGCMFRLKFQLKRYEGNQFYTVPGAVCISNPVEVFSHTYYLTNRKKNAPPPPPSVTEVLPARLPSHAPNQRCVVLGGGFLDSAQLRVRIGSVTVKPLFHEAKTLIVTIPQMERGIYAVAVANDGKEFCQSSITVSFE